MKLGGPFQRVFRRGFYVVDVLVKGFIVDHDGLEGRFGALVKRGEFEVERDHVGRSDIESRQLFASIDKGVVGGRIEGSGCVGHDLWWCGCVLESRCHDVGGRQ